MSERPNKAEVQTFLQEGKVNSEREGINTAKLYKQVEWAIKDEPSEEMRQLYRQFILEYNASASQTRAEKDKLLSESKSWSHMGDVERAIANGGTGLTPIQMESINQFAMTAFDKANTYGEAGPDYNAIDKLNRWFAIYKSTSVSLAKPVMSNSGPVMSKPVWDTQKWTPVMSKPITTTPSVPAWTSSKPAESLTLSETEMNDIFRRASYTVDGKEWVYLRATSVTGASGIIIETIVDNDRKWQVTIRLAKQADWSYQVVSPTTDAYNVSINTENGRVVSVSLTSRTATTPPATAPAASPAPGASTTPASAPVVSRPAATPQLAPTPSVTPPATEVVKKRPSRTAEEVTSGNTQYIADNQATINKALNIIFTDAEKNKKMRVLLDDPTNENIREFQKAINIKDDGDFRNGTLITLQKKAWVKPNEKVDKKEDIKKEVPSNIPEVKINEKVVTLKEWDPRYGTITHIGQVHGVMISAPDWTILSCVSPESEKQIAVGQRKIYEYIMKSKPDMVFVEGFWDFSDPQNKEILKVFGVIALYAFDKLSKQDLASMPKWADKEIFTTFKVNSKQELQDKLLYILGWGTIAGIINEKLKWAEDEKTNLKATKDIWLDLSSCIALIKKSEQFSEKNMPASVMKEREKIALEKVKEYMEKNPGKKSVLIYWDAHDFRWEYDGVFTGKKPVLQKVDIGQIGDITKLKESEKWVVLFEAPVSYEWKWSDGKIMASYKGLLNKEGKPEWMGISIHRVGDNIYHYEWTFSMENMYPTGDVKMTIMDISGNTIGTATGTMWANGVFADGTKLDRPGKTSQVMKDGSWINMPWAGEKVIQSPQPSEITRAELETWKDKLGTGIEWKNIGNDDAGTKIDGKIVKAFFNLEVDQVEKTYAVTGDKLYIWDGTKKEWSLSPKLEIRSGKIEKIVAKNDVPKVEAPKVEVKPETAKPAEGEKPKDTTPPKNAIEAQTKTIAALEASGFKKDGDIYKKDGLEITLMLDRWHIKLEKKWGELIEQNAKDLKELLKNSSLPDTAIKYSIGGIGRSKSIVSN
jgi:hypothetical protein